MTATPTRTEAKTDRLYRPSTAPDLPYLKLLWEEGMKTREASEELGVEYDTADFWTNRLTREASELVGRKVSVTFALRLLFEPETIRQNEQGKNN